LVIKSGVQLAPRGIMSSLPPVREKLKKEVLKVNFYFKRGCGGFGRN
jgi:hypothetical protein